MDEGQGLSDIRPARPMAGDAGRNRRPAETFDVAGRQRRAHAERFDRDHDLRRQDAGFLHLAIHDSRTRRRHHHRDPARGRQRQEAATISEAGRHGLPRDRRLGAAGAAGRRLGPIGLTRMRSLKSATGSALAALYVLAFVAAYFIYRENAGQFLADAPIMFVALPYTLTFLKVFGSVNLSGDDLREVFAALAYAVGALVEALARAAFRFSRAR